MGVGSDFNRLESVFGHVHLYLLDMWNKLVSKGAAKWTIIIEPQGFMDLFRKRLPANTFVLAKVSLKKKTQIDNNHV